MIFEMEDLATLETDTSFQYDFMKVLIFFTGPIYTLQGDKGISPVISHSKQSLSSNATKVKPRY